MKRLKARYLILLGVIVFAAGLAYGSIYAGIPYQDPTPEMQAEWNRSNDIANLIMSTGGLIVLVGVALALFRYISRLFRRETS